MSCKLHVPVALATRMQPKTLNAQTPGSAVRKVNLFMMPEIEISWCNRNSRQTGTERDRERKRGGCL